MRLCECRNGKWCTFIAWIFRSHLTFQYMRISHLCDDGTGYANAQHTHTHVRMNGTTAVAAMAASRDTMLARKCLSNDDTTKMWEKIPFTSFRFFFLFIDSSSFFSSTSCILQKCRNVSSRVFHKYQKASICSCCGLWLMNKILFCMFVRRLPPFLLPYTCAPRIRTFCRYVEVGRKVYRLHNNKKYAR